jgi:hypothetical protein
VAEEGMTCKYDSAGDWSVKLPGQASPIANCANYTLCDSDADSFYVQCEDCESGFRGGLLSSETEHCKNTGNPTVCNDESAVSIDFTLCPVGLYRPLYCRYLYKGTEFTEYQARASPFWKLDEDDNEVDSCAKYKVCQHDDDDDAIDVYYIMCEQCASGYYTPTVNDHNIPTLGDCSVQHKYPTKCEPIAATSSPTPFFVAPPATNSPTTSPTVSDAGEGKAGQGGAVGWMKDNMGASVGIGLVGLVVLYFVATKLSCNPNKYNDDEDNEDMKNSFDERMADEDEEDKRLRKEKKRKERKKEKGKRRSKSPRKRDDSGDELEMGNFSSENPMRKGGNAAPPPPPPPPTASDWTKVNDPTSGYDYWYNNATGESSWTDPN